MLCVYQNLHNLFYENNIEFFMTKKQTSAIERVYLNKTNIFFVFILCERKNNIILDACVRINNKI